MGEGVGHNSTHKRGGLWEMHFERKNSTALGPHSRFWIPSLHCGGTCPSAPPVEPLQPVEGTSPALPGLSSTITQVTSCSQGLSAASCYSQVPHQVNSVHLKQAYANPSGVPPPPLSPLLTRCHCVGSLPLAPSLRPLSMAPLCSCLPLKR